MGENIEITPDGLATVEKLLIKFLWRKRKHKTRYVLFCQKQATGESLPPTDDALNFSCNFESVSKNPSSFFCESLINKLIHVIKSCSLSVQKLIFYFVGRDLSCDDIKKTTFFIFCHLKWIFHGSGGQCCDLLYIRFIMG